VLGCCPDDTEPPGTNQGIGSWVSVMIINTRPSECPPCTLNPKQPTYDPAGNDYNGGEFSSMFEKMLSELDSLPFPERPCPTGTTLIDYYKVIADEGAPYCEKTEAGSAILTGTDSCQSYAHVKAGSYVFQIGGGDIYWEYSRCTVVVKTRYKAVPNTPVTCFETYRVQPPYQGEQFAMRTSVKIAPSNGLLILTPKDIWSSGGIDHFVQVPSADDVLSPTPEQIHREHRWFGIGYLYA